MIIQIVGITVILLLATTSAWAGPRYTQWLIDHANACFASGGYSYTITGAGLGGKQRIICWRRK